MGQGVLHSTFSLVILAMVGAKVLVETMVEVTAVAEGQDGSGGGDHSVVQGADNSGGRSMKVEDVDIGAGDDGGDDDGKDDDNDNDDNSGG